jgi:DNA-binding MarR family transcriptional regulator
VDLKDPESWPTGRLLVFTGRLMQQAFQEFLDTHGLTFAGLHVLRVLRDRPLAQVEVAAGCGVQTQTAGRTIERLVRNDLVTRERDPADRRRQLVRLTDKGRGILDFITQQERPAGHGPGLFEVLEDEELFRAELVRLLRRLHAKQAAHRAAQWSALAERWGAEDTSPGGPDGPPGPRMPPRLPGPPVPAPPPDRDQDAAATLESRT